MISMQWALLHGGRSAERSHPPQAVAHLVAERPGSWEMHVGLPLVVEARVRDRRF